MSNIKKDAPPTTTTASTTTTAETFESQLKELKKSQEEQYLLLSKVKVIHFSFFLQLFFVNQLFYLKPLCFDSIIFVNLKSSIFNRKVILW